MRLAVPKETRAGETRVAATPESIKKFKALGLEVVVQAGAGAGARIADADYIAAGASVAPDAATTLKDADIVLKVRGPEDSEISQMKNGAVLAALLAPHAEKDAIASLASQGVIAFAMEFLPRISRAQAMDVLSSQANIAGYKAALQAAAALDRVVPMLMTAAGTVQPRLPLVAPAVFHADSVRHELLRDAEIGQSVCNPIADLGIGHGYPWRGNNLRDMHCHLVERLARAKRLLLLGEVAATRARQPRGKVAHGCRRHVVPTLA